MFSRLILAALVYAVAPTAVAQQYPTRPIRIIVPFAVGGPSDVMARLVGQKLTDNVTRIHIHTGPLGVAGPIVFGQVDTLVNSGPPNGANDTVNDEDDLTVDIANGVIFGVWDANEGANNLPANFLTAQLANLFAHNLYINVHTSDFPGGEIRGQIVRVFGIPEPRSLALIACALGAIYLVRRRVTKAEARI